MYLTGNMWIICMKHLNLKDKEDFFKPMKMKDKEGFFKPMKMKDKEDFLSL